MKEIGTFSFGNKMGKMKEYFENKVEKELANQ